MPKHEPVMPESPEALRDKADLFDLACHMAAPGEVGAWWTAYPDSSLPHGGRSAHNHAEAAMLLRFARDEAIKAGVWLAL